MVDKDGATISIEPLELDAPDSDRMPDNLALDVQSPMRKCSPFAYRDVFGGGFRRRILKSGFDTSKYAERTRDDGRCDIESVIAPRRSGSSQRLMVVRVLVGEVSFGRRWRSLESSNPHRAISPGPAFCSASSKRGKYLLFSGNSTSSSQIGQDGFFLSLMSGDSHLLVTCIVVSDSACAHLVIVDLIGLRGQIQHVVKETLGGASDLSRGAVTGDDGGMSEKVDFR